MLFLDRLWYGSTHILQWVLWPLSVLYQALVLFRRWFLQTFYQENFPVPIIIVGNISLGGVGKTPLVIELCKKIQERGFRVGIVSRGYKAKIKQFPYLVQKNDCAFKVGDEPLLLALKTNCPVVIAPIRTQAVHYLLNNYQSQIIISDDGLQHYRMGRAIELLVIDGIRGLGNGLCLPAGPLRESKKRLKQVDFIILNSPVASIKGAYYNDNVYSMYLKPGKIVQLKTKEEHNTNEFKATVAAVAAIGHPDRFYSTLTELGIKYEKYSYPDHYKFTPLDLNFKQSSMIMTEKDAVKCLSFNSDKIYYLPVEAVLTDAFWDAFWSHDQLHDKRLA